MQGKNIQRRAGTEDHAPRLKRSNRFQHRENHLRGYGQQSRKEV
jgi:hypothetical protein